MLEDPSARLVFIFSFVIPCFAKANDFLYIAFPLLSGLELFGFSLKLSSLSDFGNICRDDTIIKFSDSSL